MSKQRRLQNEIDQTLRKITDGVEEWDVLFEKFEETEDGSQRDKIAQELKRELKKLQRLREQVRGWATDINDPRLTEARRSVEREMERFKWLEKELKIKQFSSEGLKRDSTDPVMMRKVQCADWLSDTVSLLETQVEQFEADLEALTPGPSKPGKSKPHRVVELEGFMQKHGEHVKKLEQVLRLLENDQVTPEEVEEALRDPLEYYLQSSTEADYMPDETIYDSLPLLKDVDDSIGKIASHTPRAGAKGKQEGEGEGEGAAEGGKSKRGKGGKERKAKAAAAAAEAAGAKGAAKASAAVATPPPGLPPPPAPPSPAAAATPTTAGTRSQSFKAVAAAGARPPAAAAAAAAGGSPTKQRLGGPETPAPGVQAGAASTPAAPPRVRVTPAPPATAAPPAAQPPASPSTATAPQAAAPTSAAPQGLSVTPPPPPPAAPDVASYQPVPQTPLQPLSPASAARLAGFSDQQASPARPPLPPPPPLEPLAQPLPPPALPVVSVPPGLARVALHTAPSVSSISNGGSLQGHSPFAALASAVAAAGSPFAAAAAARQVSVEAVPPPSPSAPPARLDNQSPHSVQSNSSEAAEARRAADMAAAAQAADIAAAAAAAASGTPRGRDASGRIPTVLSFNHLQSQAESVLGLAAAADGFGGGEPGTPMGGEGGGPSAQHLPWIPTLADLHQLDASVANRPQPGDGDWKLSDGSMSSPGGPPPAPHPVHVPASFPNMVHPSLQRESTFRKLSAETNFFAFYFQQGSRQQLLAANALKAQGWRFHTQINAWFARQSQPRVVTTEHEQGPLVYFDALLHDVMPSSPTGLPMQPTYSGWCPRVSRADFTFEYKYMAKLFGASFMVATQEMEDTSVPSDV